MCLATRSTAGLRRRLKCAVGTSTVVTGPRRSSDQPKSGSIWCGRGSGPSIPGGNTSDVSPRTTQGGSVEGRRRRVLARHVDVELREQLVLVQPATRQPPRESARPTAWRGRTRTPRRNVRAALRARRRPAASRSRARSPAGCGRGRCARLTEARPASTGARVSRITNGGTTSCSHRSELTIPSRNANDSTVGVAADRVRATGWMASIATILRRAAARTL